METRDKISKRLAKLEKNIYKLMDLLDEYNEEQTGGNPVDLDVSKKWIHKWGVSRVKETVYEALESIKSKKMEEDFSN